MTCGVDGVFAVVGRLLPEAKIACRMLGGHAVNRYGGIKLFALKNGPPPAEKDFPEVVQLAIGNGVELEPELRELCRRYGALRFPILSRRGDVPSARLGLAEHARFGELCLRGNSRITAANCRVKCAHEAGMKPFRLRLGRGRGAGA